MICEQHEAIDEEWPLNRIPRKAWEGELYPFRQITSMGTGSEERAVSKQEHNGNLDNRPVHDLWHASVEIQPNYSLMDGSQLVAIQGGYGDCESSYVSIDPKQALSLLEWLNQNREKLEGLSREPV